jgi:hypothetical protein
MAVPRCAALRHDGRACGALAPTPTAVFCRRNEQLAPELGEHAVRAGRDPRGDRLATRRPLVAETLPVITNGSAISPAEVRPQLARMTAESVGEIQPALLDAALGSTREH